MTINPFYLWWVAEMGRPPVAGEELAFRLSRLAWNACLRGAHRRVHVPARSRPLLATARRPQKREAQQ